MLYTLCHSVCFGGKPESKANDERSKVLEQALKVPFGFTAFGLHLTHTPPQLFGDRKSESECEGEAVRGKKTWQSPWAECDSLSTKQTRWQTNPTANINNLITSF